MKDKAMQNKVLAYFREYYAEHHRTPSLRVCGEALGVNHMRVSYYVEILEREGKLVRNKQKIYLARNFKMIDQRKRHNAAANAKKANAGRAGAAALKRIAEQKGVERFTAGMGRDEATIKKNIERIVQRAFENGTAHHPRPVYVVLVGEKVG
jgi:DNA-binding transcriptional regulator YhcF (GntR family)